MKRFILFGAVVEVESLIETWLVNHNLAAR
jgi:hypothetical protein